MNRTEKKKSVKLPANIIKMLEEAPPSYTGKIRLNEGELEILKRGIELRRSMRIIAKIIIKYSKRKISETTLRTIAREHGFIK